MNGSQESPMCEDAQGVNRITLIEKEKSSTAIKSKRRRLKKSVFNMVCACGAKFIANHNQAKYCSDECKTKGLHISWNKYRVNNKERVNKYHRDLYESNKDSVLARTKAYQKTKSGKEARKKSDKKTRMRFSEKIKARTILGKLVRSGKIIKEPCEKCGNVKVHGHHDDYSKPEEVRWLCPVCHAKHHKQLREENR